MLARTVESSAGEPERLAGRAPGGASAAYTSQPPKPVEKPFAVGAPEAPREATATSARPRPEQAVAASEPKEPAAEVKAVSPGADTAATLAPEPAAGSPLAELASRAVENETEVAANSSAVEPEAVQAAARPVAEATAVEPAARPAVKGAAGQERRLALVIGNSGYGFAPLANPLNDARDVAGALEELGFKVTLALDLDRDAMYRAVIDFGRTLAEGGIGLFYYAGHAVQVGGRNYLIPVGATIEGEDYVPVETVDLDQVLWRMGGAQNRLNVVILDSCRDNPFARSFRGVSRGLAATPAPAGTFLAYSTAPGGVAMDGSGRNSPYTAALLEALQPPGLRVEDVFKRVLARVRETTRGMQTPWTSASIVGDFYFRLPTDAAASVGYAGRDAEAWSMIKGSSDPIDFESYVEAYPESPLTPLARGRMDKLRGAAADGDGGATGN